MHCVEHSKIEIKSSSLRTLKPWINENFIKAIQKRDKLCKQMIKQPLNPQIKQYFYYYIKWLNNLI